MNKAVAPHNDFIQMEQNAESAISLLKMLANKHRLILLCILRSGEKSVSQLNELVPIPQSTLSQHLAFLRREKLVQTRREAQTIYYSLLDEKIIPVIGLLYQLYCQDD